MNTTQPGFLLDVCLSSRHLRGVLLGLVLVALVHRDMGPEGLCYVSNMTGAIVTLTSVHIRVKL